MNKTLEKFLFALPLIIFILGISLIDYSSYDLAVNIYRQFSTNTGLVGIALLSIFFMFPAFIMLCVSIVLTFSSIENWYENKFNKEENNEQ